jgi:acyl-CoA dehydrogenase
MTLLFAILVVTIFVSLLYRGRGYAAWSIGAGAVLLGWLLAGIESPWIFGASALLVAGAALLFGHGGLRRGLVARNVMPLVARLLPRLGETERVALGAGTVWWDGDLFSGRPDWHKLLAFTPRPLSPAEQAFLDGPVEELCAMLDDWEIQQAGDLPEPVWEFLKRERFFGMIIPDEHGGLGFSAIAHSAVVTRIASRSICPSSRTARRSPASPSPVRKPAAMRPRRRARGSCAAASSRARRCWACA